MIKTRGRMAASVLAVLALAGVVLAAVGQENYRTIKQADQGAAVFVAGLMGLDGTDSTTWSASTPLAGRSFPTYADPVLEVTCRFSAAAATACVEVGRRNSAGTFVGVAGISTATAGSGNTVVYDGTGYYDPTPLTFHLAGWSTYEVRVTDVSGSSTVDLLPTTVGATGAAAE